MNNLNYANMPVGIVKVHSLEVVLNRRFADGLTGVFSFSANSVRENRIVEEYDREPTIWQGSNGGRPYRITASAAYELPFGTGRAFLNDGGVVAASSADGSSPATTTINRARSWATGPISFSTAI